MNLRKRLKNVTQPNSENISKKKYLPQADDKSIQVCLNCEKEICFGDCSKRERMK